VAQEGCTERYDSAAKAAAKLGTQDGPGRRNQQFTLASALVWSGREEQAAADTMILDQSKIGRLSRMDALQQ